MSQHDRLSPTAETVMTLLEYEGPLTRQELIGETDRSERAIDDALNTLENRGLVSRDRDDDDLRVVVCRIRADADL